MSDERDPLEGYPQILECRALVRRPRLLLSGNVLEFFLHADSVYADAALVLGQKKFHDSEVILKVYLTKHPDGRDARQQDLPLEREPGEDDDVPI